MRFNQPALLVFIALAVLSSRAQLLSIDINKSEAPRPDDTEPGFLGWYDVGTGQTATHVFTNETYTLDPDTGLPTATNITSIISCTLALVTPPVGTSGGSLLANWLNKNGNTTSTDPYVGYRLSGDGAWVQNTTNGQPYTNGGALSLTISNLSSGVHTITTYHNDLWGTNSGQTWINPASPYMSRCIISANGVPVFTNTPSFFVTNDSQCGFAFFTITNIYSNEPVVINFTPDHSSYLDFVVLNGFEIDRPSAPGTTAIAINPTPGDEHVFANNDVPLPGTANTGYLTLQWQPAGFAISNYLYLGTNNNAVATATIASPQFLGAFPAFVGVTNSFNITNLNSALTYFWRVDQVDVANGSTNFVTGTTWEFRTRHLAFPTAEGYGRWARGGRGGVVIEVTNLNDSGPGSYRTAISDSGPRTIVFKVSGLIRLQSQCIIGNGYLTIAGQTAPGDGICIANWRAGMSGPNDVIMRYMRFRTGDAAQQAMDAMSPGSATHTIVDHCSSSWSLDVACNSLQSGSVGSQSAMTSYQHNIISEPLRYSYHYNDSERAADGCTDCYQPHAFAASISGEIGSYHHNLIAHSTDRNWSLAGGLDQSSHYAGSLDIRNNVVYNWNARTTDGGVARGNYESNYYKPYLPNNPPLWILRFDPINTNWGFPIYYMAGNVMETKNYITNNWQIGTAVPFGNGSNNYASSNQIVQLITNAEIFPSYVTTQTASNAYKVVLSDVGCNLPMQDLIDKRVVGEVLDGTTHYEGTNGPNYTINGVLQDDRGPDNPGFIDAQTDVHDYSPVSGATNYSPNFPWAPYNTYNAWPDSDHDGLPDWWEQIRGLNTNSAPGDFSDANADLVGDGYTELERYLGWLGGLHYDCPTNTILNVELTQYTRGFTNNTPVYTVFSPTNGTVTLSGRTALFTPTVSTNALGSFMFKVTDASGFSYTNTVGVHIYIVPTNTPPVLAAVPNQTINVGVVLNVTNVATDSDVPSQTLTFSLPAAPTNASLTTDTGIINWRPLVTQANSTNNFTVVVTDNGTPNLSATQSFSVLVNPLVLPTITPAPFMAGQAGFTISGQAGPDYAIQSSTNLTGWNTLLITSPAAMPFSWNVSTSNTVPSQFYRLKVGPPLP